MKEQESLLAVEEARARILAGCGPVGTERVSVIDAAGRTLAKEVSSLRAIPAYDNSAMDGYGVRAVDVAAATVTSPVRLRVVGRALAGGERHTLPAEPMTTIAINTGAPIPPGVDAVIMKEHCIVEGDQIVVSQSAKPGQHVRRRGEDIQALSVCASEGTLITPAMLNLLLSCGHVTVDVRRRPVVAILASGDELREVGAPLTDDDVVNSNAWAVAASVAAVGCDVRVLGIAQDTLTDHVRCMNEASFADVLVTIGGVSVGSHDFVRPALLELGASLELWKVAMRPGKPLAFGRRGTQRIFGLPGNPVSSLVCAELFLKPALLRMLGRSEVEPRLLPATLVDEAPLSKKAGLALFARAVVHVDAERGLLVRTLERQGSGHISGLAQANALACFSSSVERVEPGARVWVLLLS